MPSIRSMMRILSMQKEISAEKKEKSSLVTTIFKGVEHVICDVIIRHCINIVSAASQLHDHTVQPAALMTGY